MSARSSARVSGDDSRTGKPAVATARAPRVRAPWWATLTTILGILLVLASVAGIGGASYFLNKLTGNIETTSVVLADDPSASPAPNAGKLPEGAMNILMLGLDTRAGWEEKGESSRSDTIIILHISASHDQAYMISIPRDTEAHIPADSSIGFKGDTTRINAAYAFGSASGRGWTGGAKLATKAVKELTGISFDGVVVIDFNGFKGMLQAMGGVYMCVDKDMWSSHYTVNAAGKPVYTSGDPNSPPSNALWFRKGCRQMAAWEALEYSRIRHSSNGDYDRQRHQQQLLRAMATKATSAGILSNPSKLSSIISAAGQSLKMDTHGVPINDFVFGLKSLAGADLVALRTNGGTYAHSDLGGGEGITPATLDMFAAARDDKLGQFIINNPEFLIPDGGTLS